MTLEEKMLRLQEIQQMFDLKKVTLTEIMPLLEEAYKLKSEIDKELKEMETKIVQLSKDETDSDVAG